MDAADTPVLLTARSAPALRAIDMLSSVPAAVRQVALADLRLPAAGAVLVLAPDEAAAVLAEPPAGRFVVVVWLASGAALEPTLLEHSHVVGVLTPDLVPEVAYSVIKAALALLERREAPKAAQMLEEVLEIGRALASEKNLDALLDLILTNARILTQADGASIYTRERDGVLYFRLWQNASRPDAGADPSHKQAVGEFSIAGYVARTGETLLVDDVYMLPADAPYRFNRAPDEAIHYRTRSMLAVPLENKAGEVVGVLQLINRKDRPQTRLLSDADVERHVQPFDDAARQLALALAGQAGVALENSMLYGDIERLFEGFIKASVRAIEARDPSTAGHSFRVASFTERLAVAVDRSDAPGLRPLRFSTEQLREIRYAALLHDFGKVGVREDVLVKPKKLHPRQLELLKQRFRHARLSAATSAYRRLLDRQERDALGPEQFRRERAAIEAAIVEEHARLDRFLHVVLRANEPTVLPAQVPAELHEILAYSYVDGEAAVPLLEHFEFADLALSKGSLSPEERVEIESHVTHTYEFLTLIPWTRDLAGLPDIAYAHHEKLDGSGYPRGLAQEAIPAQTRMLTISDIYDALTAPDRPYKLAVSEERALDILRSEAAAGKLDPALLTVFIEAGAWRLSR